MALVCVELKGLPLAIEMAAARVEWETPQPLLPQLSRRLESFISGKRDRNVRQQTLRGALDWSYTLLDEIEQRVLRDLGVFRGGFSENPTQAVCDFLLSEMLTGLVEKSLVKYERVAGSPPRNTLFEIIRKAVLSLVLVKGDMNANARSTSSSSSSVVCPETEKPI